MRVHTYACKHEHFKHASTHTPKPSTHSTGVDGDEEGEDYDDPGEIETKTLDALKDPSTPTMQAIFKHTCSRMQTQARIGAIKSMTLNMVLDFF